MEREAGEAGEERRLLIGILDTRIRSRAYPVVSACSRLCAHVLVTGSNPSELNIFYLSIVLDDVNTYSCTDPSPRLQKGYD